MDNISEQLVPRISTGSDKAKKILVSLGAIVVASVIMWLAIVFGIYSLVIVVVFVLYGGVWLVSNMNVEYEYIITNNEMDIDKIIGRRKRKRMITINLGSAEEFSPYTSSPDVNVDATVRASSGSEKNAHYLIAQHFSYGKVMLIFNPNEKTREAIMQEIPSSLRIKITHNAK